MKRVKEILKNPDRDNLKDLGRAHLAKSFVLIGEMYEKEKKVRCINPRRHGEIYGRWY